MLVFYPTCHTPVRYISGHVFFCVPHGPSAGSGEDLLICWVRSPKTSKRHALGNYSACGLLTNKIMQPKPALACTMLGMKFSHETARQLQSQGCEFKARTGLPSVLAAKQTNKNSNLLSTSLQGCTASRKIKN